MIILFLTLLIPSLLYPMNQRNSDSDHVVKAALLVRKLKLAPTTPDENPQLSYAKHVLRGLVNDSLDRGVESPTICAAGAMIATSDDEKKEFVERSVALAKVRSRSNTDPSIGSSAPSYSTNTLSSLCAQDGRRRSISEEKAFLRVAIRNRQYQITELKKEETRRNRKIIVTLEQEIAVYLKRIQDSDLEAGRVDLYRSALAHHIRNKDKEQPAA